MAIDYKEIGSNIKVCRIRKNLKQAQLAEIVGVSSQHIQDIEQFDNERAAPQLSQRGCVG